MSYFDGPRRDLLKVRRELDVARRHVTSPQHRFILQQAEESVRFVIDELNERRDAAESFG